MLLRTLALVLLCLILAAASARADELRLIAPHDVLTDYRAFVDGRNPQDISDFGGPHARRDVVEVVLLQQALRAGGYDSTVELLAVDSYRRILLNLAAGQADMIATSAWLADLELLNFNVEASYAVIGDGEFEVGLYSRAGNQEALEISSLAQLQRLRVVSNRYWQSDWDTLSSMNLQHLQHTGSWESMVKKVVQGEADILLAPFQADVTLPIQAFGYELMPVQGVKLGIQGSRHFALRSNHPRATELLAALNLGLTEMHKDGRIHAAYRQCGFFNPQVERWKRLN